jgi:hypothetical protein
MGGNAEGGRMRVWSSSLGWGMTTVGGCDDEVIGA